MEYYRFFNNTPDDVREYKADDFAEYFRSFLTSGIFNQDNSLEVQTKGLDMNVLVCEGFAFLTGYLYKNDDKKVLALNPADAFLNRIDRIVLRLDHNNRFIKALVKQGQVNENPIPPELTRTETIYELSLAKINIIAGKSFVERDQIIDERMDENICGYVSSLVTIPTNEMWDDWLENKTRINNDWTTWFNEAKNKYSQLDLNLINKEVESLKTNILDNNKYLDDHKKESNPHDITCSKIGAEPKIIKKSGFNLEKSDVINSTSKYTLATSFAVKAAYDKGKIALDEANKKEPKITKKSGFNLNKSDAVTSTSKTTLATSYAVKVAYDKGNAALSKADNAFEKAEQAFISASNGKKLIANAITGVGIEASPNENFSSLADKISKVQNLKVNGPFLGALLTDYLSQNREYFCAGWNLGTFSRKSYQNKLRPYSFLLTPQLINNMTKVVTTHHVSIDSNGDYIYKTLASFNKIVVSQGDYIYGIRYNYRGNPNDQNNNFHIFAFHKVDGRTLWNITVSRSSCGNQFAVCETDYLKSFSAAADPETDDLIITYKTVYAPYYKIVRISRTNGKPSIIESFSNYEDIKFTKKTYGYTFSNGNYVSNNNSQYTTWFTSSGREISKTKNIYLFADIHRNGIFKAFFSPIININRDLIIVPNIQWQTGSSSYNNLCKWYILNDTEVKAEIEGEWQKITCNKDKNKLYGLSNNSIAEIDINTGQIIKRFPRTNFLPKNAQNNQTYGNIVGISPELDELVIEKIDSIKQETIACFTKLQPRL